MFFLYKELYNIRMLRPLTLVLASLLLLNMKSVSARTITTPPRESAITYYLQITDSSSQEILTLESKIPEFELPEDLEGTYYIEASFKDKWGREIKGEKPKTITLISKIPEENVQEEMILTKSRDHNEVVITPYQVSGNTEMTTTKNVSNQTTFSSPMVGKGIKVFSPLYRLPNWRIGFDILQGKNDKSTFNTTELDLGYNWIEYRSDRNIFLVTLNGAYVNTEATSEVLKNSDTVIINQQARTLYVYSRGTALIKFGKITLDLNAMLGSSISYFRYSAGSSILYHLKHKYSVGPSIEYAKFENGSAKETIEANMIKIGLNLILNL
jgi:hypothetical protein